MAAFRHSSSLKSNVTEDEVNNLEDLLDAVELGERFEPEVSLDGCQDLEMAKKRLKLAVKKARGKMKDYNAMRDTMAELRRGDHENRRRLTELIVKLQGQLNKIDDTLKEQFKFEEATRCAIPQSAKYIKFLSRERCPVVVAGEVSSGKSTVLNLILSEEILPAKRLSCTFTACELVFDATRRACLLFDDGRPTVNIPFEEKDDYIYKKESRDKRFEHSCVRLMLPVEILRSGVTLVDTPGVGENSTTGNIVLDYVRRKDVFGFIFAINAFDSGGVRLKFQELLHQLSAIEDDDGRRKLHPSSIIFVVNFWDKVPEQERQHTRKQIEYYLKKMPFMGGFDPEKQIFLMDSRGAMESLMLDARLITEDFSELIDGIQEFFPLGQKRKLEKAYLWMQNAIERMIHPVKAFLVGHRPGGNLQKIRKKIKDLSSKSKDAINKAQKKYIKATKNLSDILLKALDKSPQKTKVAHWDSKDIPIQDAQESWSIFEERLDKAIDDRISKVILDLESEEGLISKAYCELVVEVGNIICGISKELMDIERSLRNSADKDMAKSNSLQELSSTPVESSIEVTFGQLQGAELIVPKFEAENMFERLLFGPSLALFGPNYLQRRKAIEQQMDKFKSNPSEYMSTRAKTIYKHFCTDEVIYGIAEQQLGKVDDYIKKQEVKIPEQIESNKAILDNITRMSSKANQVDLKFTNYLEEMQELYDSLLLLGRESIITDTFRRDDIEHSNTIRRSATPVSDNSMPLYFSIAKLKRGASIDVTLMKFNIAPSCVIKYRETDRFNHQENLRLRVAGKKAPRLLGTYNSGQTLVLEGKLILARALASIKPITTTRWNSWNIEVNTYMTLLKDLGEALNEIHLRKMAHCILSLDTLLRDTKDGSCVRLTSLYELATIQINENEGLETGQLLYLAPEILFGNTQMYTMAADVYALGLLMIELWYRYDVFHELKKLPFNEFKKQYKGETGKLLLNKAAGIIKTKSHDEDIISIKMPACYDTLICHCLKQNIQERIGMKAWCSNWESIQNEVREAMLYGVTTV